MCFIAVFNTNPCELKVSRGMPQIISMGLLRGVCTDSSGGG